MKFGQCPFCVCRYDGEFFYYCRLTKREVGKSHRCLNPALRRAAEAARK